MGKLICTDHSQTLTQLETLKEKQMLKSVSVNCEKVLTSAHLLGVGGGVAPWGRQEQKEVARREQT